MMRYRVLASLADCGRAALLGTVCGLAGCEVTGRWPAALMMMFGFLLGYGLLSALVQWGRWKG
ncbi:hypothetical protein CFR75_06165 [Komagataeibacter xylinus]|uniref:Uncharacterized protein n=1 Tax=Komagataeibacter xylinus TaxID=28448 RepID=A0A318PP47_KOMXY|nr:hypothetical protein [Komagataeibacter xylinus]PYD57400.1 hypothetical protein CFR75_06165 [Komagataeibacter xylinus]